MAGAAGFIKTGIIHFIHRLLLFIYEDIRMDSLV